MEIQINKEIRDYHESMFFGLSLRQFVFSLLACAATIITYFITQPRFGTEIASWCCILVCGPFIALGYIRYNGMYFEAVVTAAAIYLMTPRKLLYRSENIWYGIMKDSIDQKVKEMKKNATEAAKEARKRLQQNTQEPSAGDSCKENI